MIIEFEKIKKAFCGAVEFKEKAGALCPRRFTDKQYEYFAETENYIHKLWKGRASADMEIDFHTDSNIIEMEMTCFRAGAPKLCGIDIYVDSVLYEHIEYTIDEDTEVTLHSNLPEGKKRVTIYFPRFHGVNIKRFEIDDDAIFKPAQKDMKLLFFGDSITQGYTTTYPSLTYTSIVGRGLNAQCVNQGIGANVFHDGDIDENLPYKPDRIFVAMGTNDWTHNRDINTEANKYLSKLSKIYPGVKIYVILPIWRGRLNEHEQKTTVSFDEMHQILKKTCSSFENVKVIDGRELVPNDMSLFNPDTTHPNKEGFHHYGNNLLSRVKGD